MLEHIYNNLWISFGTIGVIMCVMRIKPDALTKQLQNSGRDYPRELARQRDKRTCQMCAKKWQLGQRRFDIHHIVGCGTMSLEYDRIATLDNLITYCHRCHLNLHSVRQKMSKREGMQKHAIHKSSYYKQKDEQQLVTLSAIDIAKKILTDVSNV